MGHNKKSERSQHYRKDLANRANLPNVKVRARIADVQDGQVCLRDIELLDHYNYFGDKVNFQEHIWVPAKPFERVLQEQHEEKIVDFIGTAYEYKNKKGKTNYSLNDIKCVRFMDDVLFEMISLGNGILPTAELMESFKSRNLEECQERYDNVIKQLSEDAKLLFRFCFRLMCRSLANDADSFFNPPRYSGFIHMLSQCIKSNCNNKAHEALVIMAQSEYYLSYYSKCEIDNLLTILTDPNKRHERFKKCVKEVVDVITPYQDCLVGIFSSAPIPSMLYAESQNNEKVAKAQVCAYCKNKYDCNGECILDDDKRSVMTKTMANRMNFFAGCLNSIDERSKHSKLETTTITLGPHFQFRGVIKEIKNEIVIFEKMWLFMRIPYKPIYDQMIKSFLEDKEMRRKHAFNISSDGWFESIHEEDANGLGMFNLKDADDDFREYVQKNKDLKPGDVLRFRFSGYDIFKRRMLDAANIDQSDESAVAEIVKKMFDELETTKLRAYNIEHTKDLLD